MIGDEAREQALAAEGAPAGAGDRLRRRRLQRDRHLHAVPRRRRGRADRRRGGGGGARQRPPRRLAGGRAARASCTARSPRCSPTRRARSSRRTRSRPGSTIPGVGPEHAHLRDTGRATLRRPSPTRRRSRAFARALAAGGDHPGARVRPRDRLAARERRRATGYDVLCLSAAAATRTWPRCWSRARWLTVDRAAAGDGADRGRLRAAARRGPGGPDAVHDGRLPRPRDLAGGRRGLRRRRRRPDRARDALLGPARRRADDPRGGDAALAARRRRSRRRSRSARRSPSASRSC